MPLEVIAIFDIGKTNKKFFLFDKTLQEVKQEYINIPPIEDEDGDPCEDLPTLTAWVRKKINEVCASSAYHLIGLNFSTYGASFVNVGDNGEPATPLYNYLKDFPADLQEAFFASYPEETNNQETASPTLGMLNSGLQLYWLKKRKPELFARVHRSLHLPQYMSFIFTGKYVSEPTSIGCHTRLWDFARQDYHAWVKNEGIDKILAEIVPTTHIIPTKICGHIVNVGVGIHDSSSALAAYLVKNDEPFILISTGTWSITLNPFTEEILSLSDLQNDCLNYLTIHGKSVKASRFFLGHEFDHQIKRLNQLFNKPDKYYKTVAPDETILEQIKEGRIKNSFYPDTILRSPFITALFPENEWKPETYGSFEEAYHQLVWGLTRIQVDSFLLAKGNSNVKKVYIDGGFVHNEVFINLLRHFLSDYSLEFSDVPLGSAYGAALMLNVE
ncbi:MAG TPA: FGGY family carbohydrate kinase [Cyclobacteriaceae bacterium]|nr:FGGY family carbohydrate kinase [Cyclobacteriaceae bacterium]